MPLPVSDYNPTRLTVTPDWQDQEAQANATAMGLPMQPSFLDNLKTAGSNIISGIANIPNDISTIVNSKEAIIDKILGKDQERYQFWPEKLIRDALSAPHDVLTSKTPLTSQDLIKPAMDISALAGTGGLGGTGEAAGTSLGAGPFLRPALKYEGRIYKAPMGGQHMDAIPKDLQPEFTRQAMSGEDISNFNFGFMNHKGQFLDRQKALDYAVENGLLDPHDARYGALTSTMDLRSDNPTGAAIGALEKSGPFFSAAEKAVDAIPQAKMTGGQWLGTIANKPGVKPEELDWTGLKGYLESNKDKAVTKADIQEHLANNKVEVGEVNKGELSDKEILAQSKIRKEDWDKMSQSQKELIRTNFPIEKTKYHSYQLPGGENYREKLLTLPNKSASLINKYGSFTNVMEKGTDAEKAFMQEGYNKAWKNEPASYKSSHWDEPNILAHMRMNDRTFQPESETIGQTVKRVTGKDYSEYSPDEQMKFLNKNWLDKNKLNQKPKKSLHLEEIQSDWHQQGREKGYGSPKVDTSKWTAYKENFAGTDKWTVKDENGRIVSSSWHPDTYPKAEDAIKAAGKLAESERVGVPDAPFKKSWHELALKRAIYEAATNGYDRLSWTPGEAQAARYDLSKSVSTVVYKDGKLTAIGPTGQHVINSEVVPKEKLPDYIGKEAADKLLKQEPHNGALSLQGEQLKIGGEGMKGFYDKMIPNAVEKLLKEHGVKVKTANVKGLVPNKDNKYINNTGTQQLHYIEIPQSLKNQAKKGFPLFSAGPLIIGDNKNE